jgi:hypothetical protein
MLTIVAIVNRTRGWYERRAVAPPAEALHR